MTVPDRIHWSCQVAAVLAALLLLCLLASSVHGWRHASVTARNISTLSSELQAAEQRFQALEGQLSSAVSQQVGQQSRCVNSHSHTCCRAHDSATPFSCRCRGRQAAGHL